MASRRDEADNAAASAIEHAIVSGDADAVRAAFEASRVVVDTSAQFYGYWMLAVTHYPGHVRVLEVLKIYVPPRLDGETPWTFRKEFTVEIKDPHVAQWFGIHYSVPLEATGVEAVTVDDAHASTEPSTASNWSVFTFPRTRRALAENFAARTENLAARGELLYERGAEFFKSKMRRSQGGL